MELCPVCGERREIHKGVYVDPDTNIVFIDGDVLRLTRKQNELFSGIYSTVPRPARISFLMDYMYGLHSEKEEPNENILKVFMTRIRRKLKPTRFEIETVWGVGYRLKERNGKDYHEWKTREVDFPGVHHSISGGLS